jgi:hypothetical protein
MCVVKVKWHEEPNYFTGHIRSVAKLSRWPYIIYMILWLTIFARVYTILNHEDYLWWKYETCKIIHVSSSLMTCCQALFVYTPLWKETGYPCSNVCTSLWNVFLDGLLNEDIPRPHVWCHLPPWHYPSYKSMFYTYNACSLFLQRWSSYILQYVTKVDRGILHMLHMLQVF